VFVTAPAGDPNHLFVAEQRGTVQQVVDGQVQPAPFLDVTDHVLEVSERGFLGIAFAPDYATSGRVYVDYTDRTGNGNLNVVEFRRSEQFPDRLDPYSARQILEIDKPYENHNAGMLQFGPDGYLYVAVGDGDSGVINPPGAFAQTLDDLLGTSCASTLCTPAGGHRTPFGLNPFVARNGAAQVWDYGLRNPGGSHRPANGDLCIGDAGKATARRSTTSPATRAA
jgi:glucose/arabinose dehydrogenase